MRVSESVCFWDVEFWMMLAFDSILVAKKAWGHMTFFRERKIYVLIYLNTHSLVVSFEGKFII